MHAIAWFGIQIVKPLIAGNLSSVQHTRTRCIEFCFTGATLTLLLTLMRDWVALSLCAEAKSVVRIGMACAIINIITITSERGLHVLVLLTHFSRLRLIVLYLLSLIPIWLYRDTG